MGKRSSLESELAQNWNDAREVDSQTEDEILEVYESITANDGDAYLSDLPKFFEALSIPLCFTNDIATCITFFYDLSILDLELKSSGDLNAMQMTALRFVRAFTITKTFGTLERGDIIDILDVDKLIKQLNILMKFRNHYRHILNSWKQLINASNKDVKEENEILKFKLGVPELRDIRDSLITEQAKGPQLGDPLLIDMLSIGLEDDSICFYIDRKVESIYITIKRFAQILGFLGELS